jgi:hypothetical protein
LFGIILKNYTGHILEKKEWAKEATNILKAEMVRSGLSYNDMLEKLAKIGIDEDYKSLANKIGRGTFSFIFFMQCMKAMGKNEVKL